MQAYTESEKNDPTTHFQFGENWRRFLHNVTDVHIRRAEKALVELVGKENIEKKTFLDIGCGSGLHSLGALRSGASHVVALDIDLNSVVATREVLTRFWRDKNYEVSDGNILTLGKPARHFDVVYSWGVLHHTGDMWNAIKNASLYVNENGHFAIAIYQKTKACDWWTKIKRFYVKSPSFVKSAIVNLYAVLYFIANIARGQNPLRKIRDYEDHRGMHWKTDVIDWVGGYPYESATAAEIKEFVEGLGFRFVRERSVYPGKPWGFAGSVCGEYVFKRK